MPREFTITVSGDGDVPRESVAKAIGEIWGQVGTKALMRGIQDRLESLFAPHTVLHFENYPHFKDCKILFQLMLSRFEKLGTSRASEGMLTPEQRATCELELYLTEREAPHAG